MIELKLNQDELDLIDKIFKKETAHKKDVWAFGKKHLGWATGAKVKDGVETCSKCGKELTDKGNRYTCENDQCSVKWVSKIELT